MAVPHVRIEFDPDGYYRASEPGFDWEISGFQLATRQGPKFGKTDYFLPKRDGFYNPPGSDWLLPLPLQWNPNWYRVSLLEDYVARLSGWGRASSVSADMTREYEPTNTPFGSTNAFNQWMIWNLPASLTGPPISVDFTTMAAAIGGTFPSGMQAVATTGSINSFLTPHLQLLLPPAPTDWLVFGFGDIALALTSANLYVLRTPDNDHQSWELLGVFAWGTGMPTRAQTRGAASFGGETAGATAGIDPQPTYQRITVVPVGPDRLYFHTHNGIFAVDLRDSSEAVGILTGTPTKSGPWWFAGIPNQSLHLQVQSVAYQEAVHAIVGDSTPENISCTWFDFGANGDGYRPTVDPQVWFQGFIPIFGDLDEGDDGVTVTDIDAGKNIESDSTGAVFEFQVIDTRDVSANDAWVSDGILDRGAFHLKLTPGSIVGTGSFGLANCCAPQIRLLQLKFPAVLDARATIPATLDDDEFHSIHVEAGLRDHDAKRISIVLTDSQTKHLESLSVDGRHDFPFHVTEETTPNSGVFDNIRIAGWIDTMEYEELTLQGGSASNPVRLYRIVARGLLSRLSSAPWRYIAGIVDPANLGKLEHTTAVAQAFRQAGFDEDNPFFVAIESDPAPEQARVLPGTPDQTPADAGTHTDSPYAPKYSEEIGEWAARIGREWRGWYLYETLGRQMRYEHDILDDILLYGETLVTEATIYATRAAATSAGRTGDYYLATSEEALKPVQSNFVRVIGKDAKGDPLAQVIDSDLPSITDPTAANFCGDVVRPLILQTKMAISEGASKQIARVALRQLARKGRTRKITVGKAPWNIGASGIDVNSIVAPVNLGQRLVVHLETVFESRRWESVLTCEKLPDPPVFAGD